MGCAMYHFVYASKGKIHPVRDDVETLIHRVQDEVRSKFTFQYKFVGSASRNMVTYDTEGNKGFDFDINIEVNDEDKRFGPKEIKHILMNAFHRFSYEFGYDTCEDSTRVFTIKVKDRKNSKIRHSCDFAIVHNCGDGRQQYIRFHKAETPPYYSWEYQGDSFYELKEKVRFCKKMGLWTEVRELYLEKKNQNTDPKKKSRTIFAETIHQICQKNGYYKKPPQTNKNVLGFYSILDMLD